MPRMCRLAHTCGLALSLALTLAAPRYDVSRHVLHTVSVPTLGGGSAALDLVLPSLTATTRALTSPAELFDSVAVAYSVLVEPQQAGLTDAKQTHLAAIPLSPAEAWHHFSAARAGVVDSARFLLTFSLIPSLQEGGPRLHVASALGALEEMRALLASGVDVDARKEADGLPALAFALAARQLEAVLLLISAGADVEARGHNGATPLMIAAALGFEEGVSALLAAGAQPEATHPFALSTALHWAAEMGRAGVLRTLCSAGVRCSAVTMPAGATALHTASDCNQTGVLRILVEDCACDTTALLAGDSQPLYMAAQRGFTEVCDELITLGAPVDWVQPRGEERRLSVRGSGTGAGSGADSHSGGSDPLYPTQPGQFYSDKNTKVRGGRASWRRVCPPRRVSARCLRACNQR